MVALLILIGVVAGVYAFFRLYPPFGGRTPISQKRRSPNFVGGKFVNQIPTPMNIGFRGMLSIFRDQLRTGADRRPAQPLVPERLDVSKLRVAEPPRITWFGHSAFLLHINGKNLLLDPMFGRAPSPFPAIGPQRFSAQLPATPEELPPIDAVLISHDHYDHLDYGSIQKLSAKVTMFFVPLGLAVHLQKWGVAAERITELDWWDERSFEGLTLTCTPSRHFSGRTLTDRFATLWCSWAIVADKTKVFFSGDSGYGPHFKQIGDKYGPFDLTLLECGQYDPHWSTIHMMPEQTVTAHADLHGIRMVPMHWGAFVLALHSWTDPVERVLAAGAKAGAIIMTPKIGETFAFTAKEYPVEAWWKQYDA
jgi:L-ascorbate metabolism protein UlaG (beta-lactamase superfamily)